MTLDSTATILSASALIVRLSGFLRETYHSARMSKARPVPKPSKPRHFVRQWRKHRMLTIEQLAERVGVTHGAIGQLERGEVNYTQPMLEAIAEALMCSPGDLVSRDPASTDSIWLVWSQANEAQRDQIVKIAETITQKRSA